MADALPKGLVTTKRNVLSNLNVMDRVDIEDILLLWKVHSTSPYVLGGDVGYRLQNLFWRICGSSKLSVSIRGSTVARLFTLISEAKPLSGADDVSYSSQMPSGAQPSSLEGRGYADGKAPKSSCGGSSRRPLHPILKRSSGSQGESGKTTRLLLTDPTNGESITRKPSNPPTPNSLGMPYTGDVLNRQTQNKSYSVANRTASHNRKSMRKRHRFSQKIPCRSLSQSSTGAAERWETMNTISDQSREQSSTDLLKSSAVMVDLHQPFVDSEDSRRSPSPWLSVGKAVFATSNSPEASRKLSSPVPGFKISGVHPRGSAQDLPPENIQRLVHPSSESLVDADVRARFAETKHQLRRTGPVTLNTSDEVDLSSTVHFGPENILTETVGESLPRTTLVRAESYGYCSSQVQVPEVSFADSSHLTDDPRGDVLNQNLPEPQSHLALLIAEERSKHATSNKFGR